MPSDSRYFDDRANLRAAGRDPGDSSTQKTEMLSHPSPCWFWETDAQNRVNFASVGFAEILGIPPSSLLGRTWDALNLDSDSDQRARYAQDLERRLPLRNSLIRTTDSDGHPRLVRLDGEPMFDPSGTFTGYRGVGRDLTNQGLIESELYFRSEMLRSIIDHSPVSMSLKDLDGRYFLSSGHLGTLFGRDFGIEGKTAFDLFPHEIAVSHTEHDQQVARSGLSSQRQYQVEVDGERHDYLTEKFPVKDEQGRVRSIGSISSDITELKRSEQEIRDLNDELEIRMKELRATQENLLRSERLSAMGQLVGTVSHELRNPLGTIRSSFHTLQKVIPLEEQNTRRVLARIDRNIERCVHIIEGLLDYARLRKPRREIVDIDSWIEDLRDDMNLPDTVSLVTELNAGIEVDIDPTALARAVYNVVDNAAAATVECDPPGGEVRIVSRVSEDRLEISITDQGVGMDQNTLANILEPLFSTKGFGVGLGLPTVVQILESHGGGLEIDSSPGQGTTMTLWLSLTEQTATE